MLSPEAELRALVRSLEESDDPPGADHLSLSEVRAKIALGIRAVIAIQERKAFEQSTERREQLQRTVDLALLDLDRGSPKPRSGL